MKMKVTAAIKTGSPKRAKGNVRREAIEAEARQLLLEKGYPGVSLRTIASQLGISLGNLQYYFPTKDDLVEAVIASEAQKPIEMLDAINWDPDDASGAISRAVGSLLRYYASEAGRFYAIMESLALHDPRYARLKAEGYARVFNHVERLAGLMTPHLAPDRRTGLAQVLVALIDGASLQLQFSRGNTQGEGVDALIKDVSTAIDQLLKGWA